MTLIGQYKIQPPADGQVSINAARLETVEVPVLVIGGNSCGDRDGPLSESPSGGQVCSKLFSVQFIRNN